MNDDELVARANAKLDLDDASSLEVLFVQECRQQFTDGVLTLDGAVHILDSSPTSHFADVLEVSVANGKRTKKAQIQVGNGYWDA